MCLDIFKQILLISGTNFSESNFFCVSGRVIYINIVHIFKLV